MIYQKHIFFCFNILIFLASLAWNINLLHYWLLKLCLNVAHNDWFTEVQCARVKIQFVPTTERVKEEQWSIIRVQGDVCAAASV